MKKTPFISPLAWFEEMIDHCYDYAETAHVKGAPIVGIMCEYTPREIIMAAGGIPVCLCGGSAQRISSAEKHLPANLCPLIKSTFGYHLEKANPFLEWADLLVAETTCDGKKKMYELLAETRPMHVLELPQKVDDPDAFEHWVCELRKLRDFLEKRYRTRVTAARLRRAIATMNRERRLRRELAALLQADAPPLTGRQLLDLKSIISGIPADLEQYGMILKWLRSRPESPALRSRVRVLLTGVPVVHGAERVVDLIEKHGGLVVAMENCTGLRPLVDDVDPRASDPLRALAQKYFHLPCSVMTPNRRRLDLIRRLAADYRADCVVDLIWQACLTYDVESARVKRLAEEELKLPFLRIETDYSPSDSARLVVRLEALFETIRRSRR
ncbi:MAG: double-cubane-cluster-containing anaerobic reductase [Verrucomicrobiae bacterium]|nr:double-cubane-cluster-containing anaerobic reductase [Verrucomicrobiae bacterium]